MNRADLHARRSEYETEARYREGSRKFILTRVHRTERRERAFHKEG